MTCIVWDIFSNASKFQFTWHLQMFLDIGTDPRIQTDKVRNGRIMNNTIRIHISVPTTVFSCHAIDKPIAHRSLPAWSIALVWRVGQPIPYIVVGIIVLLNDLLCHVVRNSVLINVLNNVIALVQLGWKPVVQIGFPGIPLFPLLLGAFGLIPFGRPFFLLLGGV